MKAVLGMTTLVVFGIGPVYRGKALGLTSVTSVITWAPDITRVTTPVTRVTLPLSVSAVSALPFDIPLESKLLLGRA